jgi:hypothetical protein
MGMKKAPARKQVLFLQLACILYDNVVYCHRGDIMKMTVSLKWQEKILKKALGLKREPKSSFVGTADASAFFASFPESQRGTVYENLRVMQSKGLINIGNPTIGPNLNLSYMAIMEVGLSYFDDRRQERKKAIAGWTLNIAIALLSALFGAVLARVSMLWF